MNWTENILNQIGLLMLSDIKESFIKSSENVRNKYYKITMVSTFSWNF